MIHCLIHLGHHLIAAVLVISAEVTWIIAGLSKRGGKELKEAALLLENLSIALSHDNLTMAEEILRGRRTYYE